MGQTAIVILDRSPHQGEFFVQSFKEQNIPVYHNTALDPLLEQPVTEENRLFLLDYQTMTFEQRESIIQLFRSLKNEDQAIVFNVPPDASKRIIFYELGALRVFDRTINLDEVFNNVLWWYQQITLHPEAQSILMQGQLETIDLLKLLWGMYKRGVTGVLELTMKRNHGEIYFKNGQIIHAQVLTHQGIDALLHLTLWSKGVFEFKDYNIHEMEKSIHNTILALSIQISETRLKMFALQEQFKSETSVVQLMNTGDLPLYKIELEPGFVEYISQPRELGDVLENPFYPNHQTMMILNQLKKVGLLRINNPIEAAIQETVPVLEQIYEGQKQLNQFAFDEKQIANLRKNLQLKNDAPAKIVVISDDEKLLKHFQSQLAGGPERVIFEYNMYLSQFLLGEDLEIILIGIRANPQLLKLLSVIEEQINGYVFLINAQNLDNVGYYSYLINQSLVQHPVPAVCAVTYLGEQTSLHNVEKKFLLSWKIDWTTFKANDLQSMVSILASIKPVEPIEVKKEKTTQGEQE